MVKKVVLAYSGGLDTSIMIKWIKDKYNCEIIAYCADVGQAEELNLLEEKAKKSGASKVHISDLKKEFAEEYLFPLLKSGAIYESKYLLGTSIARPLIAKGQVEVAKKEGADAVSHGATGKGNDQVRFELTYKALAPDLQVIAPWREWDMKSREDEIEYAAQHGIHVPVDKEKPYSSDRNLWHISYEGGILEDPWAEAPENIFLLTKSPKKAPDEETFVEIEFEKGIPKKIDGKDFGPVELLQKLNQLGGENGVGRVDIVENRLVGMKSRGVYETPGGTILYTALPALESITIDRESQHYKKLIAEKYAAVVYNGQWFTPLREAFDAFINKLMENVSGTVKLKLYKGNCTVAGRKSPNSLYRYDLATFGEEDIYNQKDAEGFINLFGLPMKVQGMRKKG